MFANRVLTPKARAATQAIEFHAPPQPWFTGGIGGPGQPDHATLLRESSGFNATAVRAISNRMAQLNPLVKVKRREQDGTETTETLDDHPLKTLLDRPHPDFSRSQLLRLWTQWTLTCGEAYALKVANGFRRPTELHPIPPSRVSPILGNGAVRAYAIQEGSGKQRTLPADVIVRFYFPDPEDPWYSEGYLAPNGIYADTLKFSGQHLRRHFQKDATPKTVLEAQADAQPFDDPAREAFWARWRQAFDSRNGERVGLPGVVPPLYKLVQLAFQSGAEVVPLLDFLRDAELMAYFTPRSVLGQVVSGDRSSAEVNQWVFDRYAVAPIAQLIQESLTLQLARDFDLQLVVEFEDFVSADKEFELKREAHDLEHGVRTINHVLTDRDDDEVDWGDEPTISTKLKVYDPDAPEPVAVATAPSSGQDGDEAEADADLEEEERALHARVRRAFRVRKRRENP